MRFRAGVHLVFTREALEQIPTATLAITDLRVTSYSKKRGHWGEEWEVWVVGGGGECKTFKEEREKERKESEHAALSNRLSQANFP